MIFPDTLLSLSHFPSPVGAVACCTLEGDYNRFGELSLMNLETGWWFSLSPPFQFEFNQPFPNNSQEKFSFWMATTHWLIMTKNTIPFPISLFQETAPGCSLHLLTKQSKFGQFPPENLSVPLVNLPPVGRVQQKIKQKQQNPTIVHEDKVNRLSVNPHDDQILASCCNKGWEFVFVFVLILVN